MEKDDDKGNRYALHALRNKRGEIASEIVTLERKLRHLKESLVHVDASLQLLDPSIDTDKIPNKRPTKRVKLFRQGELNRLIMGAFRDAAQDTLSAAEIVSYILERGGLSEAARKALAPRVRGNLAYLSRIGRLQKEGAQQNAKWAIQCHK